MRRHGDARAESSAAPCRHNGGDWPTRRAAWLDRRETLDSRRAAPAFEIAPVGSPDDDRPTLPGALTAATTTGDDWEPRRLTDRHRGAGRCWSCSSRCRAARIHLAGVGHALAGRGSRACRRIRGALPGAEGRPRAADAVERAHQSALSARPPFTAGRASRRAKHFQAVQRDPTRRGPTGPRAATPPARPQCPDGSGGSTRVSAGRRRPRPRRLRRPRAPAARTLPDGCRGKACASP